jgi:hypothetical protein
MLPCPDLFASGKKKAKTSPFPEGKLDFCFPILFRLSIPSARILPLPPKQQRNPAN